MKITSIELAGKIEEGNHLPETFVHLSRKLGAKNIVIKTITPDVATDGIQTHEVPIASEDRMADMAERLQYLLDGLHGTRGRINDYYKILELLTD